MRVRITDSLRNNIGSTDYGWESTPACQRKTSLLGTAGRDYGFFEKLHRIYGLRMGECRRTGFAIPL